MSEYGTNINDCIHRHAGQFGEQDIRVAIDNLQAEGLIYSTVNEEHFKAAN
jgi:hypothetical protein